MMKKIVMIFAAVVCVVQSSMAQEQWTLARCIEYAIENNIELRQTELTVESAANQLNTTRNSRLPNLSASAGQSFSFGRAASEIDNSYINTQSSNTSFSLSTSLTLFRGFSINNQIKADKLDLEAASAGLERAKESLELNIAGLYLSVLLRKEVLAVNREQTALMRKQVDNTAEMVENGGAPRSQLYDIEAQLAQSEVNEVTAENNLAMSLLNLAQILNLEHSPGFDIADIDADVLVPTDSSVLLSPDAIYEVAVSTKPVVREAELNLESSRRSVRVAKAAYYPSLSLGASYGNGYYYMFGQDYTQQSFADQIRNKHGENVGINMSIPIFSQNRTRNSVRSARIAVANNTLRLEGVKKTLYNEIREAHQTAVSAEARYEATVKAMAAAQESFRAMELRYNNSKATAYEYSEANTQLLSTRSQQAQAKYDYLFSTKILDFYNGRRIEL